LTVPDHLDYVARTVVETDRRREEISGLRLAYEPARLRFF
jgi:tryptophanase